MSSDRSGMGKSLYIQRLVDELKKRQNSNSDSSAHIIIPLHGPEVTPDIVIDLFKNYFEISKSCIYHIDIGPWVNSYLSIILFFLFWFYATRS